MPSYFLDAIAARENSDRYLDDVERERRQFAIKENSQAIVADANSISIVIPF